MHIWTQLLLREGATLALLVCVGAGPAAFLNAHFDFASRLALAPVLGFALATCVATNVLQFAAADSTYWLLVPLGLGSLGLAAARSGLLRRRRLRLPLSIRDVAQLIAVVLVVAGPVNYALHHAHSTGPVAYTYTDVDTYVAEIDGARHVSTGDASTAWTLATRTGRQFPDFTQKLWSFIANYNDKLDAAPFEANANALLGLDASQTNAPDLVVLLLLGGLGAFGALRYATRSRTEAAVLAASLFGGPLFLELWFDSYEAALPGLALLLPIAALGHSALTTRRLADVVLLAILVACLMTVYPLFAPPLFVTAAGVLLLRVGRRLRAGERLGRAVRPDLAGTAGLVVLTAMFDPIAVSRNIGYIRELVDHAFAVPRVGWHLPVDVIPGWVFQTREFWDMPPLGTGGLKPWILGLALPLVFVGVVVYGAVRYRPAWALIAFVVGCCVFAEYSFVSEGSCTYCAERDLLPLGAILAGLLGIGVWALLVAPFSWGRWLGVGAALLVLLAVGQRTRVELTRFINGSYFQDQQDRTLLTHLPRAPGRLLLEGYGGSVRGQAELPLVYNLANALDPGNVTVPLGASDFNSLAYLTFNSVSPYDPPLRPDYRYVLTRLGGIRTSRRIIDWAGGMALERRTQPLDITPFSGIGVPLVRLNPAGTAWVQPQLPLRLYITGGTPGPVWARLAFRSSVTVAVPPQRGVTAKTRAGLLIVCVPATGTPPIRVTSLRLIAAPPPGPAPPELFPPPMPLEGVALSSMQAVAGACVP